ncbi:hypothetical protein MMC28_011016, partial [Mycoblastus sanguinarius]|nr:hypothetical protein [Mycoblastus sanguinarius]
MGDPVSAAASIIAAIQICGAVLSACYQYINAVNDAPRDIYWVVNEVGSLKQILEELKSMAENARGLHTSTLSALFKSLDAANGPLKTCETALREIVKMIGAPGKTRNLGRVLIWPLKEKGVQKILELIQKQKCNLILALVADETRAVLRIEQSVEENGNAIQEIKGSLADSSTATIKTQQTIQNAAYSLERERILRWLQSPDASTNYNAARQKHEPGTGAWLLGSVEFSTWKSEANQLLWLCGVPGAGKTILSSIVIEYIIKLHVSGVLCDYAYFYFDFQDSKKQKTTFLLRSVLVQLAFRDRRTLEYIRELYNEHGQGKQEPSESSLTSTLLLSLQSSSRIYLVLDALDECTEKQGVLSIISKVHKKCSNVNILITSRIEHDIELVLKDLMTSNICIQNAVVDVDIRLHVQSQLVTDPKLKRFPEAAKQNIEATLVSKADG